MIYRYNTEVTMIRKILFFLISLPVFLFGCSGQMSSPVQFQKALEIRPSLAMATAIVVMETATPANPCADFSCATITPAPSPTVESSPSPAQLAAAQSAPFQDCQRAPGLVKCDPEAAPLGGEVAYIDGEADRVVALHARSTGQPPRVQCP